MLPRKSGHTQGSCEPLHSVFEILKMSTIQTLEIVDYDYDCYYDDYGYHHHHCHYHCHYQCRNTVISGVLRCSNSLFFCRRSRSFSTVGPFKELINMPKTSSGGQKFRLQDIKKQRERRKTKTEKGRQEKEEETWKHEKKSFLVGGFLGHFQDDGKGGWV